MTEAQNTVLKNKIIALIEKSKLDIVDIEKMTQPISPENSIGRISRMDAINNKSVMEAALRSKKIKFTKLKLALTKIDDENFGDCSSCKNPIQSGRLMFMPESTLCIRCANR
ncbi:MAG: TraR/DksA C4-type zinc finger protein [Saprospiraceae bacterium]